MSSPSSDTGGPSGCADDDTSFHRPGRGWRYNESGRDRCTTDPPRYRLGRRPAAADGRADAAHHAPRHPPRGARPVTRSAAGRLRAKGTSPAPAGPQPVLTDPGKARPPLADPQGPVAGIPPATARVGP